MQKQSTPTNERTNLVTRRHILRTGIMLAASVPILRAPMTTGATTDPVLPRIPDRWDTEPDLSSHGEEWDWERWTFGWDIDSGAWAITDDLCYQWGWLNGTIISDGHVLACPSDDDRVRALLTPTPAALIIHELCVGATAEVPPLVQRAFELLRPRVFTGQEA